MPVSGTSNAEDTVHNVLKQELYKTACNPSAHHHSHVAEMLTQLELGSIQDEHEMEQPMRVPERVSFCCILHDLTVNKLSHIAVHCNRKLMMQGIDETLAEAFELGSKLETL